MSELTPEQALAYLMRFEILDAARAVERSRSTIQSRFKQLSALMSSRHAFGVEALRERDVELVRKRWARLKQALDG
jgi:hypothetical protein